MSNFKIIPLIFLLILMFSPLIFLLEAWVAPSDTAWTFFLEEEFTETICSTIVFSLGTVLVSLIIGVYAAYIAVYTKFPGQSFFQWALLLPLALPAYILGFSYLGLFESTGVIQKLLIEGGFNHHLPNIRNMVGAILFKSFTLFPYIYLLTKSAFSTQSNRLIELSQLFGYQKSKIFFKVLLPLSWPWIFSGMMLVFMEALSDFGMVKLFNVETFTTVIYSKWSGEQSFLAASRISFVMLIFLSIFFIIQYKFIGSKKVYANTKEGANYFIEKNTSRLLGWVNFSIISFLFFISFALPILLIAKWALKDISGKNLSYWNSFYPYALNSFLLSAIAGVSITIVAIIFSLYNRSLKSKLVSILLKVSTMGYALPGTLLGIGVFAFLNFTQVQFGLSQVLTSTIFALLIGYLIRFNAVAFETVNSAFERISPSLDESASMLGKNKIQVFFSIHFPIIKMSFFSSIILVFVDVLKELPFTLIMRPYGWDTLAIKIYNYSSEGEWGRASFPSLLLHLVGVIPILVLTKFSTEKDRGGYVC